MHATSQNTCKDSCARTNYNHGFESSTFELRAVDCACTSAAALAAATSGPSRLALFVVRRDRLPRNVSEPSCELARGRVARAFLSDSSSNVIWRSCTAINTLHKSMLRALPRRRWKPARNCSMPTSPAPSSSSSAKTPLAFETSKPRCRKWARPDLVVAEALPELLYGDK